LNRNAETVASRKRDFILHLSRLPRNGAASWGHALVQGKSNHGFRSRVNKELASGEYVGQTANERARLRALCRRKLRTQPRLWDLRGGRMRPPLRELLVRWCRLGSGLWRGGGKVHRGHRTRSL